MSLIVLFLLPSSYPFKIGHLQSTSSEARTLAICMGNFSAELISVPACDHFNGVESAAKLNYEYNVDVFIGGACDLESETVSRLAFRWDKLYISTSLLSTIEREGTTIALHPNGLREMAKAVLALCRKIHWNRVGIVYSPTFLAEDKAILREFESSTDTIMSINVGINEENLMETIVQNTRIILVFSELNEYQELIASFTQHTQKISEFVVIYIGNKRTTPMLFFDRVMMTLSANGRATRRSLNMINNIFYFQSVHHDRKKLEQFAFENNLLMSSELESSFLLCDAIQLLKSVDIIKSENLWKSLVEKRFDGFSGPIFISHDGLRLPFFRLYNWIENKIDIALKIEPSIGNCNLTKDCTWHVINYTPQTSRFLAGVPKGLPECGFDGSLCNNTHIFFAIAVVICILSVPLGIAYSFQRREKELLRMPWRIAHEQLTFEHDDDMTGYRRISTASSAHNSFTSGLPVATQEIVHGYIFGRKVTFYGEGSEMVTSRVDFHVSMKVYTQKRAITFSRQEMEYLNQLKYLNHANVNCFVGISFNQNNELIFLWSYCVRHSLEDIFFVKEQRFGRIFQSTFLKHILNGIQYIHNSAIRVHGSLYLSNCVVDSYWVVKLTDFGLRRILNDKMDHKELYTPTTDFEYPPSKYLQLAPEHLEEMKNNRFVEGSTQGDVYQLGMLIYQILFYKKPFNERNSSTSELISIICDSNRAVIVRPAVPEKNEFTMRLLSIMQQCWLHRPQGRPALFKINDAVAREFANDAKGSLVDQMIKMIDEYSENLEGIVAKRTRELEATHAKTEKLLYQIMPKCIADDLRESRTVQPQMHTSVSVLIADVCGFTALCESHIPIQVLEILQQLYSSFDTIVSNYRAFKVENFGDAYLIVSGIPELTDHEHLKEVCRIGIQLQKFVEHFVMDKYPEHQMKIKVGINSGSVASGILGSTAPRFCLFGNTVNMACRMASSGEPGRIQINETTADIIKEKFKSFIIEQRGTVHIKGKGSCITFWVLGEIGGS